MELKEYQQKTLTQVKMYLDWLVKARDEAAKRQGLSSEFADSEFFDFTKAAWSKACPSAPFYPKKNGLGESLPDFYIKIPTGGGKTLLACHIIDLINRSYLRRQTGIVLWIIPTTQIYRQTLDALRDRDIRIARFWTLLAPVERWFARKWSASPGKILRRTY